MTSIVFFLIFDPHCTLSFRRGAGFMYCAVQKNSVPAAAGVVATSHTVFLLHRVHGRVTRLVPSDQLVTVSDNHFRSVQFTLGSHSGSRS